MSRAEAMLAEEELTEVNELLVEAAPTEILRWAVERFFPRLTMATAFGPEGCVLIHLLAEVEPRVRVFNLDTGYQFPETLALRDQIAERYGIEVEMVRPDTSVGEYESLAQRTALRIELRAVLLRAKDHSTAASARGLRLVDHGDPGRPIGGSSEGEGGWLGPQVQPREGQPPPELDPPRRLGLHRGQSRPLQPVARSGVSLDWLLALYQARGQWTGRTRGSVGGTGQDRVRAAFAGQQPALSCLPEGPWRQVAR